MTVDEAFEAAIRAHPTWGQFAPARHWFEAGWWARDEAAFDELVSRAMDEARATVRAEINRPDYMGDAT